MLVRKFFYKELVGNAVRIFTALVFILPITELFKLLESASNVPASTLFSAMTYGTIASFPMILTIACFMSVVVTINRYCKDHEYAILLSSGISPYYWLYLTTLFALPMAIICALCTMYITPWASGKNMEYMDYVTKQQANLFILPGSFVEPSERREVFYMENYSLVNGSANKIFIKHETDDGDNINITADSGQISNENGLFKIIMNNGHQYQIASDSHKGPPDKGSPDKGSPYNIAISFKRFIATVKQEYTPLSHEAINIPTSTVPELFRHLDNHAKAEISWRISNAVMMFIMCILAVPLSIQTGRVQNGLAFVFVVLIYGAYQNIVLSINNFIGNGSMYALWSIIVLHIIMLGMAFILTLYKAFPSGFLRLLKKNKS